jgi:hypothetical protein
LKCLPLTVMGLHRIFNYAIVDTLLVSSCNLYSLLRITLYSMTVVQTLFTRNSKILFLYIPTYVPLLVCWNKIIKFHPVTQPIIYGANWTDGIPPTGLSGATSINLLTGAAINIAIDLSIFTVYTQFRAWLESSVNTNRSIYFSMTTTVFMQL